MDAGYAHPASVKPSGNHCHGTDPTIYLLNAPAAAGSPTQQQSYGIASFILTYLTKQHLVIMEAASESAEAMRTNIEPVEVCLELLHKASKGGAMEGRQVTYATVSKDCYGLPSFSVTSDDGMRCSGYLRLTSQRTAFPC